MPASVIELPTPSEALRPAPRLPASYSSLADLAARRPSVWSRLKFQAQRAIAAVEPWYDWGSATIFRINAVERDFSDESEGEGYRFEIQWFGFHFGVTVGRTPPAVSAADRDARKAMLARKAVQS